MNSILDYPCLVFILSLIALWFSALLGAFFRKKLRPLEEDLREEFGVVQTAILTLLGLLIGFAFSMALGRYDQRKNYEQAEANAIGTEYMRADLLATTDAARVRELLRSYLDQRVLFYTTRDLQRSQQINTKTTQLQNDLWSTVLANAAAQPPPTVGLTISGMNDVLNSQGYTQAAWSYRIPVQAWALMALIAVCCNLLLGYGARRTSRSLFLVVPLAVSVSFFLIADIDSPHGGLILVHPQNLLSVSQTLRVH
jgi:hypothetical protein